MKNIENQKRVMESSLDELGYTSTTTGLLNVFIPYQRFKLKFWRTLTRLSLDGPPQSEVMPWAQHRRGRLKCKELLIIIIYIYKRTCS